MSKNKKENTSTNKEIKEEKIQNTPPMRRIVIETDGNNIKLVSAEVSGRLELTAILQNLINFVNQPGE